MTTRQLDDASTANTLARGRRILQQYAQEVYHDATYANDEDTIGEVLLGVLYAARFSLGSGEGQAIARHIADIMEEDEEEMCDDPTCTTTLGDDGCEGYCAEHADEYLTEDEDEEDEG